MEFTYLDIELQTMVNETNIDRDTYLKEDPDDKFGMKQYYEDRLEVLATIREQLTLLKSLQE